MNILSLFFFLVLVSSNVIAGEKSDFREGQLYTDSIIIKIQGINFSQYNGLPADSLLSVLPAGFTEMRIGTWRTLRVAEVLYIKYPNNVFVAIHVRNFQHMNPHWQNTSNPIQHWDINLFKQELITFTIAFNQRQCINGCENEHK